MKHVHDFHEHVMGSFHLDSENALANYQAETVSHLFIFYFKLLLTLFACYNIFIKQKGFVTENRNFFNIATNFTNFFCFSSCC